MLSPTPTASAATLNPLPRSSAPTNPVTISSLTISPAAEITHNVPTPSTAEHSVPTIVAATTTEVQQTLRPIPTPMTSTERHFTSPPNQTTTSTERHFTSPSATKIRWQRAELIGSGAFGRVYLGLNLDTGQLMAVKHLDMAEVSGKGEPGHSSHEQHPFTSLTKLTISITLELSALSNEVQTLKGLRHENIVQYLGCDFSSSSTDPSDPSSESASTATDRDSKSKSPSVHSTASSGMLSHHPAHARDPNSPTGTFSIFLEYVSGGSVRNLLDKFGTLSEDLVNNYSRQLLLGLEYLHHNGIAHRDIKAANILIANDGVIKLADFGAAKRIAR